MRKLLFLRRNHRYQVLEPTIRIHSKQSELIMPDQCFTNLQLGFYERLIGIVKNLLKRILGRGRLTYDEIHTFISETENIVNTRALTYLSEENFDEPLSPYHLIHGRNLANTNHFTITKT